MAVMVQPERAIRCPKCEAPLGQRLGPAWSGLIAVRYGGREIIGPIQCIRHEGCGGVWRPDPPDLGIGAIEYKQEAGRGTHR